MLGLLTHDADAHHKKINMPTNATYYIDAETLEEASAVYLDAELNTLAEDGFYSDSNISREQVEGALLPSVECPTCT
jgi:hypothetical protein